MEKFNEFGKCDFCPSLEGIMSYASPGVPDCRMCKNCEKPAEKKKVKKVWTEKEIVELLGKNNKAVEKAIVAVYNRQTADEKASYDTKHSNGVGFSGADAKFGTYLAKWILSGKSLNGKFLAQGRVLAVKYRAQLLDEANKP